MNNNTTPQYDSHMAKKTSTANLQAKFPISPLDGTYFANISSLLNQQQDDTTKATIIYRNYPFTP